MKSSASVGGWALALMLCGCATVPPHQPATPTLGPTPASASPIIPGPSLNARGNIPKQVGEYASIIDAATGETVADWKITLLDNAFTCLSAGAKPSKNGHYLALSIELVAGDGLATLGPGQKFSLNPAYFSVLQQNGAVQEDPRGNADTCIDATYRLPSIGADQKATGLVVLDVTSPHGFVVYRPIGVDGGWEWSY